MGATTVQLRFMIRLLAAQRARAAALIAAVARSLAKRKQGQGKADDKGKDPPRPRRFPGLLQSWIKGRVEG